MRRIAGVGPAGGQDHTQQVLRVWSQVLAALPEAVLAPDVDSGPGTLRATWGVVTVWLTTGPLVAVERNRR